MSDLQTLYRELIIDHGRRPRNFGSNEAANSIKEGFNPLCGDRLTVYLLEEEGIISNIQFKGVGCAISIASASMMTEVLMGKTIAEAETLFQAFHQLVTQGKLDANVSELRKLNVLAGVLEFPARIKCATLAWHTMRAAIHNQLEPVSTE